MSGMTGSKHDDDCAPAPDWPRAQQPDAPTRPIYQHSDDYFGASIYNYANPRSAQLDEDLLARSIRDAGHNAFGTVFIEVYVLSTDGLHLARPSGGHWIDPGFLHSASDRAKELDRTAPDCVPGESLAGTLFNECHSVIGYKQGVRWRQIRSMMRDPFIQLGRDCRMEHLYEVGIGIVGAVPFSFQQRKGIVLYMSRATAAIERLRAEENENYLVAATDLIGAAFAIRIPSMECSRIRRERFKNTVKKARKEFRKPTLPSLVLQAAEARKLAALACGDAEEESQSKEEADITNAFTRGSGSRTCTGWCKLLAYSGMEKIVGFVTRLEKSRFKWRGAGLHAAPRQSLLECVYVFVGVFVVMLSLARLDIFLKEQASSYWTFDPGWYASSLCIVFALTAAPVGQPVQIVLAHVWNILCGLAFQYIPSSEIDTFYELHKTPPEDINGFLLPISWKGALAVAFGISGQAYLGIIHPPASGLSFAFATRGWGPGSLLIVLVMDLLVVGMSVVILNLDATKQYPMFWIGRSWKQSTGRNTEKGWLSSWRKKKKNRRESDELVPAKKKKDDDEEDVFRERATRERATV